MSPSYLVAAGPVAKARGMRSLLWFAHPSVTPMLQVAERVADVILTSLPGSYPRPSAKVRVIGQAVDTDALAFGPQAIDPTALRLIAVGRTSPSKGFDTAIRAVASLRDRGVVAGLRIVGPSTNEVERRHRVELAKLAADLGLASAVSLEDGVAPGAVAGVIAGADVLVNAMVAGSGDKVVFEALALGRPAVASNPALAGLLGGAGAELGFRAGDPQDLAATIVNLLRTPDLTPTLLTLRGRVERDHSLGRWADEVMSAAARR
jgi:glycosyltransferase involved in cell wall biosynthesis